MVSRIGCLTLLGLATVVLVAAPPAVAQEKLELIPQLLEADQGVNLYCVLSDDRIVAIDVWLKDIDPANPIKAANINLAWDPDACWELIDIVPGEGFDQFGTEDCGPGFIRYSVIRELGQPGITEDQPIATVWFETLVAPEECCIETVELTEGAGASETKVVGDGYVQLDPILLPAGGLTVIFDGVAPSIECVDMIPAKTDPGICTWTPSVEDIPIPVVLDNCDECQLVLWFERSDGVGDLYAPYQFGETLITWYVADCCGNTSSCVTTVWVEDKEAPVISPDKEELAVSVNEDCVFIVPDVREANNLLNILITDNCLPDINVNQTPPPGTVWGLGSHDLVVNANDSHGNNAVGNYTVLVEDNAPPVFVWAPEDVSLCADPGKCTAKYTWHISAEDNCGPVTLNCIPKSGYDFPIGTTTVECTATDQAGNVSVHTFDVEVRPSWKFCYAVDLRGFVSAKPFTWCLQFDLVDCDVEPCPLLPPLLGLTDAATFERVGMIGRATGCFEIPVPNPCVEGHYECARVRAIGKSLWSHTFDIKLGTDPDTGRPAYIATWQSDDALCLGNINADTYIDILDWIIWQHQFLNPVPPVVPPADPCNPLPDPVNAPNADVSGDGLVSPIDFGHLYVNNFKEDDPSCCLPRLDGHGQALDGPGSLDCPPEEAAAIAQATVETGGTGPLKRVSVHQLKALGMDYAIANDLNGDGFVDMLDMSLSMAKKR